VVDFINEVEEELRKDEYNRYLKRYGPYIATALAVLIIGVAFSEWRDSQKEKLARAMSLDYMAASEFEEAGQVSEAVQAFDKLAAKAPSGYAGLSLIRAANLKLEAGEDIEAVRYLDLAAAQFEVRRHQELAQMKAAYILANEGAYSDVMNRVQPLTEKGAPYEFLARELLGLAAYKTGDEALARENWGYLSSIPGVPATIKERADAALGLMRVETALKAPEVIAVQNEDETETTPDPESNKSAEESVETPNE